MKRIIIFLLSVSSFWNIRAQGNFLYYDLQKAKQTNAVFQDVSASIEKSSNERNILQYFDNEEEVSFIHYNPSKTERLNSAIFLSIPLKNRDVILELLEVPSSYKVVTSNRESFPANIEIKHYHGIVRGQLNSLVALTFYKDEIIGLIATDEGNFNISKEKSSGKHIIFEEKNLKNKSHFECGTNHNDNFIEYDPEVLLHQFSASDIVATYDGIQTRAASNPGRFVKFYIEVGYDIFQNKLSDKVATEVFISGMMNQIKILYYNENIATHLQEIYIWTQSDPYNGTNLTDILEQFQKTRKSFNGDLGMLVKLGNTGGKAAVTAPAFCNSNVSQKLAVSLISSTYANFPVYSNSVFAITHEFGHLFGSEHTHACVWNGNNTAIDGCDFPEGGCSRPSIPLEGTIMSYCYPNINFNLGFGLQPGNVIRNGFNWYAPCLTQVTISSNSATRLLCGAYNITCTVTNAMPNYTWTQSNNLIAGSESGNSKTFTATSSTGNEGWVAINIDGFELARYLLWIGKPELTEISGPTNVSPYQSASFEAVFKNDYANPTSYEWILNTPSGSTAYYNYGKIFYATFNNSGSYQVICRATNSCGQSDYCVLGVQVGRGGYSFVSPNPTSDVFTVSFNSELIEQATASFQASGSGQLTAKTISLNIKLMDSFGIIHQQTTSTGENILIDVSNLQNGIYFLYIYDGIVATPEVHKVIVNH